ncbi:MAG: lysine 2,3-aminomutase [Dehalococcoidales bacterium]|jgi:lysine 2,3-aminomutase
MINSNINHPKNDDFIEVSRKIDSNSTPEQWNDWRWHIRHLIKDIPTLERLLGVQFGEDKKQQLKQTLELFPMRITPYYLSLIDAENYENDPIFKQSVPSIAELNMDQHDMSDPLEEDKDNPAACITHRYPDRVLFHVSNLCAMYCRHCTRKRKVGDIDQSLTRDDLKEGIDYIRNTPVVRDVLLSGGDPFLLSDDLIDWILTEIERIPHVEVIRIGTRTPVVLPQRITKDLLDILKKHHPIWINTHFNHPREITDISINSLAMLADAGIPLGNQSVLLAGINDCPRIMKALVHKLVRNRVRPYYLYQCDLSEGLSHFRTSVSKGVEIMENLIGHTSGFAVPSYVIDAPGGGGKIPVMPTYVISSAPQKVVLRNYEGIITTYHEPQDYHTQICDDNCSTCQLELDFVDTSEQKVVGIAQLLADYDETNTLIPEDNERLERRVDDYDQLTKLGNSLVQHGKNNNRIYLMNLDPEDAPDILETLDTIASKEKYGKITAKVPARFHDIFTSNSYKTEAVIPQLFNGKEDGYFMGKFLDEKRATETNVSLVKDVLKKALAKEPTQNDQDTAEPYIIRPCTPEDAENMAAIYKDVFLTYPFPIDNPEYIINTMQGNISYFGAWYQNQMVAISSAEQYTEHQFAEMTDFATLPSYQGEGIASLLLNVMEQKMREKDFTMSYTSARAVSYGMNGVFSKMGYKFAGTLINNTCISGHIENMNIWYKRL